MTRKLSVTESQRSRPIRGTVSRRKLSVASASFRNVRAATNLKKSVRITQAARLVLGVFDAVTTSPVVLAIVGGILSVFASGLVAYIQAGREQLLIRLRLSSWRRNSINRLLRF